MSSVLLFPLKVMCYVYCLLWYIPEALSLHVLTFFSFRCIRLLPLTVYGFFCHNLILLFNRKSVRKDELKYILSIQVGELQSVV